MSAALSDVSKALSRVEDESRHVEETLDAFDRFDRTVRETAPVEFGAATVEPAGGGAMTVLATADRPAHTTCDRIRERFVETIRPHSVEDVDGSEPLVETMREELGEEPALALAPNGPGGFTAELKRTIISAIEARRAELRSLSAALERERESLETAAEELESVIDAIRALGDCRLLHLDFEALRRRHDRLSTCRHRCDRLSRERQATLDSTTSYGGAAGLSHRTLIEYLYHDRPTTHPVLSAVVELDRGCAEGQRALRDHLSRRV